MFSHCLSLFYTGAEGALVNDWQWQEVVQPLDILYLGKNILLYNKIHDCLLLCQNVFSYLDFNMCILLNQINSNSNVLNYIIHFT